MSRTTSLRWLLALIAALALSVAACAEDAADEPEDDVDDVDDVEDVEDEEEPDEDVAVDDDIVVGMSISTLANPFFVTLADGAEDAAAASGVTVIVSDAQDDAQTEADNLQDFVTQEVDVIVINPVDSDAAVAAVENANAAGIPVVTVDRGVEGGEVVTHIASDNVLGGQLAGEFLFSELGDEGEVAQLEGVPGTSAARDRGEGFELALDDADAIELATSVTANFSRDEGFSVAQDVLQANPDVAGMFAQNDEMALGAVEAAEAAGVLEDLVIVGFDATDDALVAIDEGRMAGTIAQLPFLMGQLGVESAAAVAAGEDVEAEIPVEVELVTADNVGEFLD